MASSSWSSYHATTNSNSTPMVMYCIWTIVWLCLTSIVQFVYCDSLAAATTTTSTSATSVTVPAAEQTIVAAAAGSNLLPQSLATTWNNSTALLSPFKQRNSRSVEKEDQHSRVTWGAFQSRNLIADPSSNRQDICESDCKCSKDNNFITINCDFSANKKLNANFGSNYVIPQKAIALTIKLAPNTNLQLKRGFLQNRTINQLLIEGNMNVGEQVEIDSGAFDGNRGPFPQIEIINCHSVVLRSGAFTAGELKINIQRSNDVIIFGNAFEGTQVIGTLNGINDLRIEEQAFNKSKARLNIISSHIDNLYRFEASLKEIRFFNCTIGTVNSGTFDVIEIDSIKFEECKIGVIKSKAVTEKLFSQHLVITGVEIGIIESEAISGSGISELIFSKNKIDTIQPNAIYVNAVNAKIYKNNITFVGNQWLNVREWSNISIQDNMFGVFERISLEKPSTKNVSCKFESNSLTKPLKNSLNMPYPMCKIREVSIKRTCMCKTTWLEELSVRDLRSETYCMVDEKLQFCFNTTMFNVLKYLNEVCDEQKTTLDCVKNRNLHKINGQFFTQEELEMRDAEIPKIVFIAAGALTLILLAMIAMLTARHCASSKKKGSSLTSKHVHEFSVNDRRIIEETVEIIKNKYPHIHKQVSESTKNLLRQDVSEEKCVDIVSGIVNLLGRCQNTGRDFGALNEILLKHLDSMPSATAPPISDPIYAEPTAPIEDGYGRRNQDEQTNLPLPEHIYAEPGSVQQPLLRGEYALPQDRHTDLADLYSEPITDPPAYATTNLSLSPFTNKLPSAAPLTLQRPQLPSTSSQNLPDVLGQSSRGTLSKPLTNVQKMAQNLENSPQFSGRLPIYTEANPNRRGAAKPPPIPSVVEQKQRRNNINASSSDSGSDHSGGSDVTVNIDDIEYADA